MAYNNGKFSEEALDLFFKDILFNDRILSPGNNIPLLYATLPFLIDPIHGYDDSTILLNFESMKKL